MDKKYIWIITGIIAILIPVIVVMCLYLFVWVEEPQVIEPEQVDNGGTIVPEGNQGLYEFKSKYGYKLNYNPKYNVDFSGNQFDFYITNDDNSVNVQVTPIPKDETITSITTKEEWDAIKCPALFINGENDPFGTCAELQEKVPDAATYVVKNGGHRPHFVGEQVDEINALMLDFLSAIDQ